MVEIVEVSPRDRLQNESVLFSTAQKVALIARGGGRARRIDVESFVRADRVPPMADAKVVVAAQNLPATSLRSG